MGDFFKQKVTIIVAYGIIAILLFFITMAMYTNRLNEQLNTYSYKVVDYIDRIMKLAKPRNENAINYALSDSYFDDTCENIIQKQHQDEHITTLCKEIKSLVPDVQSVLAILENGEVYAADDTFDNYLEQFKDIKNSELYKDTCKSDMFTINKYNKYFNVECYSYSSPIFDKDGRKLGTFVITYTLNGHWDDINSLNKDDFAGTIIFETFDKQVLAIIDENGIERYSENELIGDRAYDILDDSKSSYTMTDYERQYRIYFAANNEKLVGGFLTVRIISLFIVLGILLGVIIISNRRKEKYILEIAIITTTSIMMFVVLWFEFNESYCHVSELSIKINQYNDIKKQEQIELSYRRAVEAYVDFAQSSLLKNINTQITASEFANLFGNLIIDQGTDEYNRVNKTFASSRTLRVFLDENRFIDLEKNKMMYTNSNDKEIYNRTLKSGNSELEVVSNEKGKTIKSIYYKVRILSKFTMVFNIEYDMTNFYESNMTWRLNVEELGESYFISYEDGLKIGLVRANEISEITDVSKIQYVDVDDSIFNGNIKKMIDDSKDYDAFLFIDANGKMNRMVCFNNKQLKRIEAYALRKVVLNESIYTLIVTTFVQIGLFASLLLYNYLEIKRIKRKDKKEEILLHGNY